MRHNQSFVYLFIYTYIVYRKQRAGQRIEPGTVARGRSCGVICHVLYQLSALILIYRVFQVSESKIELSGSCSHPLCTCTFLYQERGNRFGSTVGK